jgi:hypothetical protein
MTVSGKLAELLESGELDWDDERQREAYLRAWAAGVFSPNRPEAPWMPVRRTNG